MVRLLSASALILLAIGCGGEPIGAKVSFVETRVDETQSPLPFVIALKNSGDAAVDVAGVNIAAVEGVILSSHGIADEGGVAIAADDCQIEMREGHPVEVAARGEGVACGFVRWTPPGAAPTVGVAAITFLVTLSDGETVGTPPRVVLLRPQGEEIEQFIAELAIDPTAAQEALRRIESLQGEPTVNVERLIDRLRSLSE